MPLSSPVKNKNFTVGVLYLHFCADGASYRESRPVRALKKILSCFKCEQRIVYIDNAATHNFSNKISENEYELSGDNSLMEFSGWQKGVDFLKENDLACDVFLFVNDMFLHNSFFDRKLINRTALECAIANNAMVGRKRYHCVRGKIMGNDIIPYVRTHIFIVSAVIINALGSLAAIDSQKMGRFFIPAYDPAVRLFNKDAPISRDVKDFISYYVTSRWHRSRPYTSGNFEALKNKAAAILNSFLLSVRIKQLGYQLIAYDKVKSLSSGSAQQLDQAWFQDAENIRQSPAPVNKFWSDNTAPYHYLPKKNPELVWEGLKNFIVRRSDLGHL